MRVLGRFVCALAALGLIAEVLEIFGVPAPVLSAVAPVLAAAALAVVALFAWRLTRPTTRAQAAGAADTPARLKGALQNAPWFPPRAPPDTLRPLRPARPAPT